MEQQNQNIDKVANLESVVNKQNNFLVILLSVLLLLSVSIAGFFAYQTQTLVKELTKLKSSSSPVSSIELTPDPTVDWKTYVNNDFGFSFYYPKDYKLASDGWEKIGDNSKGHYVVTLGDPSGEFSINLDIRKASSRSGGNYKEIIVANTTAYEDLDSSGKYVFFEKDGYSFDIQLLSLNSDKTNTEVNLIFDQIISTFKFKDSDSTTNWKTYPPSTTTGLSYSFKYPETTEMTDAQDLVYLKTGNSTIYHRFLGKQTDLLSAMNNFKPWGTNESVVFSSDKKQVNYGILEGFKLTSSDGNNTFLFLGSSKLDGIVVFHYPTVEKKSGELLDQILPTFKVIN